MSGRAVRATPPTAGTAEPTVRLEGVSVFYGEVVGLSNVTLALRPGITGIVGPNGSGKSTMMRALTGLIAVREGTVRVLGEDPFTRDGVRSRIAFVPATECFFDNLSGRKNLEVAFLARGNEPPRARELAREALDLVRLAQDGHRAYRTWSRGMRQRLKLGLALVTDCDVALLDEPFLGVDPPSRRQLRDIIFKLGEDGRTVLVSSHVLHEIESLTDRVGVLAHGRLLGFGRVQELLRDLRDRHPHRIRIRTDRPRELAGELVRLPHVRELQVPGDDRLEFVTDQPDTAYRELPALVASTRAWIHRMETLDDTLEAVFRHVTATGTRRL